MTFLLWQRDGDVAIAATRRVFGAAEVPLLREANDLCRRLHALHLESDARIERAVVSSMSWTGVSIRTAVQLSRSTPAWSNSW